MGMAWTRHELFVESGNSYLYKISIIFLLKTASKQPISIIFWSEFSEKLTLEKYISDLVILNILLFLNIEKVLFPRAPAVFNQNNPSARIVFESLLDGLFDDFAGRPPYVGQVFGVVDEFSADELHGLLEALIGVVFGFVPVSIELAGSGGKISGRMVAGNTIVLRDSVVDGIDGFYELLVETVVEEIQKISGNVAAKDLKTLKFE